MIAIESIGKSITKVITCDVSSACVNQVYKVST